MPASVEGVDVAVVGSGAAGLSAALVASVCCARVLVLEKSTLLGGTSAMSGGGTWIPCNRHAREAGVEDSPEDAMRYLHATAPEGWAQTETALWQSFVEHAPVMLDFFEEHTQLRFELVHEPDPFAEAEGGRIFGRMLTPSLLDRAIAGPYAHLIRGSTLPQHITYNEAKRYRVYERPMRAAFALGPRWLLRMATGRVGCGNALIAGLLEGCTRHGCRIVAGARVTGLSQDAATGRVEGVSYETAAGRREIAVRQGVVLATGGFEWDPELLARHFPGPVDRISSPRTNTGDGQRLAEAAGALLERMDQANIYGALPVTYEGRAHGMPAIFNASPHAIVVDRHGKRFVSEYHFNIGEALDRRDPETGEPVHLPAWIVGDRRFLHQSVLFPRMARREPGFLIQAETLDELALRIDLPPASLGGTVARFNGFAAAGRDEDFQRGESVWERYMSGSEDGGPNKALGTIERRPFVACKFNRSLLGTKGGARTNAKGQVLRPDGSVIPGLYCAGNAMANPFGTRAVGSGTTIGPCLTWGHICGLHAVREGS